ncbi:MAG TPA: hypothetical protein VEL76_29495, partial [Gemmataceae bacterium]|nr:hypothetical protein [Gemmataceae bacterium]
GYADGLWHLFAYDPPYASAAGECPRGCPLARQMAEQGCEVTNRLHRPVRLTEEERMLLRRLDGQTPRTQLASELGVSGESLEKSLRLLAESALLVG